MVTTAMSCKKTDDMQNLRSNRVLLHSLPRNARAGVKEHSISTKLHNTLQNHIKQDLNVWNSILGTWSENPNVEDRNLSKLFQKFDKTGVKVSEEVVLDDNMAF